MIIREDLKSRKTFKCSDKILPIQNQSTSLHQANRNMKGATFLLKTKSQKIATITSKKTRLFLRCQKNLGRKTKEISTRRTLAARK